ncbi:hypothetical protein TNCV_1411481 [Trichonephila clavipes]|nr:hypothetical protein TNCV_1411481 [Trichonephila clavipes]
MSVHLVNNVPNSYFEAVNSANWKNWKLAMENELDSLDKHKQLHPQLRETRSFHVTRYDAGRRRAVLSPRLEESNLIVVADRSKYKSCCSLRKYEIIIMLLDRVQERPQSGAENGQAHRNAQGSPPNSIRRWNDSVGNLTEGLS